MNFTHGIHAITNNQYHASDGISRSMLMDFKRSPYHYWYKHLSGLYIKEEPTPAMNIGSAVHTLVLEEYNFENEFYVCSQLTKPRKGTAPYEKMLIEAEGKTILSQDDYTYAITLANSVKNDVDAKQLLDNCSIEQSIYFAHDATGLQCKSRPDALSGAIVIDLKTSADASKDKFQSSAWHYGYYLQAAMVHRAMQSIGQYIEEFVFICVEKTLPHCVAIYTFDKEAIDFGLYQFDKLMWALKKCMDSNIWPGYGIQKLGLPAYAKFENELEIE